MMCSWSQIFCTGTIFDPFTNGPWNPVYDDDDFEIRQTMKRKHFDFLVCSDDELNIVIPLDKKKSKKSKKL